MKYLPKLLFVILLANAGFLKAQTIQFTPFGSLCQRPDTLDLDNYVNLNNGRWELIDIDGNGPGTSEYAAVLARMVDSTGIQTTYTGKYYWRYHNDNGGNPLKDSTYMTLHVIPDLSTVRDPAPKCFDDGRFDLGADFPFGANFKWSGKTNSKIWYTMNDARRDSMVERDSVAPHWYNTQYFFDLTKNNQFIPNPGIDKITIHVKQNTTGCEDSTTFNVRVNPNPVVILKSDSLCRLDGAFRVNNKLLAAPANPDAGIYTWQIVSATAGVSSSDYPRILEDRNPSPFFSDYWFNPNAVSNSAGCYELKFCYQDGATNCRTCDSTWVCIKAEPNITFKPFDKFCYSDDTICLDSYVNHKNGRWELKSFNQYSNGTSPYSYAANRMIDSTKIDVNDLTTADGNPNGAGGTYYWRYTNAQGGCQAMDSVQMVVSARPQLNVTDLDTVFKNAAIIDLADLVTAPNKVSFLRGGTGTGWYGTAIINKRNFDPSMVIPSGLTALYYGPIQLNVLYKHPNTLCSNTDSIDVVIENKLNLNTSVSRYVNTFTSQELNANYQWVNCDNNTPVPGANQRSFTPTTNGNYKVVLSLGNFNLEASECLSVDNVGVNKLNPNLIQVYPNPVENYFLIKSSAGSDLEIKTVTIYNSIGKLVWKGDPIANQSIPFKQPKGIYLMHIQTSNGTIVKKIIK